MVETITATLFSYIDRVPSRWSPSTKRSANAGWAPITAFVTCGCGRCWTHERRSMLTAASTAIRYPLRWHHLALVMWYPTVGDADELARLQGLVGEVGAASDVAATPLFIATDRMSGWA